MRNRTLVRNTVRIATSLAPLLLIASAMADDAKLAWMRSGVLSAPEAAQAAAADEKFFYAIGNKEVAKYDRETGERVAVSSGEAKHLNSGFLWDGRLYCAHSNFPSQPEQSDIKVLDPKSMELSAFKDFGNFGGSLTWVIRHEGHWWCNFARYRDDNDQTFLVKFDDDWSEKDRWTYPSEVIREMGHYSISGGVWRDGTLLVTGHDRAMLYRLRLPKSGTVLEFIDQQPAPFAGQGIAIDLKTNGLVGIQRTNRQIVLASLKPTQPLRLRVLSYNIHHAEGVDGKLDLARIARVIRNAEPDLVSLQEVDRKLERTGSVDQAAELGQMTQMEAVFGGNIPLPGGDYGNAVLSRLPIRRQENHKLPRFNNGEQRGVLELAIDVPGNPSPLLLMATHLDHRTDDAERLASAKAINEMLAELPRRPALLVGDLNAIPDSRVMSEFATAWTRSNDQVLLTIPVVTPKRQIDYIFFRPTDRWKVLEAKVIDEQVASDHRPILAVLELQSPN